MEAAGPIAGEIASTAWRQARTACTFLKEAAAVHRHLDKATRPQLHSWGWLWPLHGMEGTLPSRWRSLAPRDEGDNRSEDYRL